MSEILESWLIDGQGNVPVSIDASKELRLEVHVIETRVFRSDAQRNEWLGETKNVLVDYLVPITFDFGLWDILKFFTDDRECMSTLLNPK
jgi:hypothetical protein